MKQLSKFSILLLFVAFAFCACDKNDDNGNYVVCPNPSSIHVSNYSVTVETVVEAPQAEVKSAIEQDLADNPPFGGCKDYQIVTTKISIGLDALRKLHIVKPNKEDLYGTYIIENSAEKFEDNEKYRLFPASTATSALAKWDIMDYSSEKPTVVGTYDVFIQRAAPDLKKDGNLFLCEDLTKKYRDKYPEADIHAVVRRLVLTCVKSGDIVKD